MVLVVFPREDHGKENQSLMALILKVKNSDFLVGGLEHCLFVHMLGIIIPTDFHIFQRG